MNNRLARIQETIAMMGLDALLVTGSENQRYLSGFTGTSALLLISIDKAFFITDFRYIEQAEREAPSFTVVTPSGTPEQIMAQLVIDQGFKSVGFEADHVSYQQYQNFLEKLPGISLEPTREIIEKLREVKDEIELSSIQKAVDIADEAFDYILGVIKPGLSEKEIATELEYFMKKLGSEKPAFDSIVASGARAALPHGVASDKQLAAGDFIVLDFGAVYNGYHSDMTRTVVLGKASDEQKKIYDIVLNAQLRAIEKVRTGIPTVEVDATARIFISEKGFGPNFGHGLGHSLGLAIHEKPGLAPKDTNILTEGMVVTVEPGIYIRDWGGVRIEDIVVVTDAAAKILTSSSKKLMEL